MVTERHRALLAAYGRLRELSPVAAEDTRAINGMLRRVSQKTGEPLTEHPDEFSFFVRSLVRTFFAEVEAISYSMRMAALDLHRQGYLDLSLGEQLLLAEVSYTLEKGKVRELPRFNSFLDNLRLRYRIFLRAFGIEQDLQVDDHRWSSFKMASAIRDAITHPKDIEEFEPSNEAMKHLGQAIAWFGDQRVRLMDGCLTVLGEPVGIVPGDQSQHRAG